MKIKSHTSDSSFSWINGNLSVYISALSSTKVTLKFADFSAGAFSSYRFLARNPKTKEDISIPFTQIDLCTFQLDLLPFQEYFQFKRHSEFILTLSCVASDNSHTLYALRPDNNFNKKYHIFAKDIYFPEDTSSEPAEYIGIFTARLDNLIIDLCSRTYFMENLLTCAYHSLKMSHGVLRISFDLEKSRHKYIKTGLFFRSKLAEDAVTYDFTTKSIKSNGNLQRITVSLNLRSIEWKSLYWDIFVLVRNADTGDVSRIPIFMTALQRMQQKFLSNVAYKTDENFYFYPYYTSKQTLAFVNRQREKYDGMDIIFKEFLSVFLYRVARPYWKRKHICLVCEKFSSMAQDNGYYFFKHCMEQDEEAFLNKKIYYIIDKDSPDRSKVEPYKNRILDFMSIRHMVYLLAADLSSAPIPDTIPMPCSPATVFLTVISKKFLLSSSSMELSL